MTGVPLIGPALNLVGKLTGFIFGLFKESDSAKRRRKLYKEMVEIYGSLVYILRSIEIQPALAVNFHAHYSQMIHPEYYNFARSNLETFTDIEDHDIIKRCLQLLACDSNPQSGSPTNCIC